MFFVYVLQSEIDGILYTGFTTDLQQRLQQHNQGKVTATANRRPLTLIYYEAYLQEADAMGREVFLKSGSGKRYLKKQLVHHFAEYPWGYSD